MLKCLLVALPLDRCLHTLPEYATHFGHAKNDVQIAKQEIGIM